MSKIRPVLRVVSSVVMEIFTSNVRAKQSGHGRAKNRLLVGRVWNLPKTNQ